ncbi:MAG: hypothetical protein FVQ80_12050 [Planctomycetes bacterium]|nr:hypothetical protein [Planctomycetota bacterium]
MDFRRAGLEEYGFEGFVGISYLKENGCGDIPKEMGVYVVIRESSDNVCFLEESIGGHFKGKNPTVSISELEDNWIDGAYVINIGKAGGTDIKATLFSRINQYIKFGKGKNIGHRGGRYIWQLKDSDELLIAWKPLDDEEPEDVESELINDFRKQYGERPFANLQK